MFDPEDVRLDYHPLAHIPAGRKITPAQEQELLEFWLSVGRRVLTSDEIEAICGAPLDTPTLKREFGTGMYPTGTEWN